ncbi:MAG: hypothetical protein WCP09_00450 [Candidatus Taylorbacteria bacterium]
MNEMTDTFFSTQLLDGKPPHKEKQHHLAVLFIIITIIGICFAIYLSSYLRPVEIQISGPTDAALQAQMHEAIIAQLNQQLQAPTATEQSAIDAQLRNKPSTATPEEQNAISNQLISVSASEI